MIIRYEHGDLIDSPEILISHGCNAQGKYQSGVAKTVRERLPFAYHAYMAAFEDFKTEFSVGQIIWAISIDGCIRPRIVANMITQDSYGRDKTRVYLDYDAMQSGLRRLNQFVAQTQAGDIDIASIGAIYRVAFPLIGCGLAGGSWRRVSQMIEAESHCYEPVVYTLDGLIPSS